MNHTPNSAQAPSKLSAIFSLLVIGLAGCQPHLPPTISPPVQTASQSSQATVAVPITVPAAKGAAITILNTEDMAVVPSTEPTSEGTNTNTAALATTVTVPAPPKPTEITDIDPHNFLKKPVQNMTDILGEADFMRVEGQIGIWQFRQKNCVVDFFFRAADADGNPSRQLITALDVRSRIIGQPLDEKGCHEELYQRRL